MDFQNLLRLEVRLRTYSYQSGRQSFSYPEDSYSGDWALLACTKGVFRFSINELSGNVYPGEIVLCPPGFILRREVISTLTFHFARFDLTMKGKEGDSEFPHYGKLTFHNPRRVLSSLESIQKLGVLAPIYYKEHLVRDILLQNLQEQASQQIASVPDDPAIQAASVTYSSTAMKKFHYNFWRRTLDSARPSLPANSAKQWG